VVEVGLVEVVDVVDVVEVVDFLVEVVVDVVDFLVEVVVEVVDFLVDVVDVDGLVEVVDVVEVVEVVDVVEVWGPTYGYVVLRSPNLMLEKVALTVAAVVSTPVVQVPAFGEPSSHDMPLAEGSSHKLTAKTIPVVNAVVNGFISPTFSHPVAPCCSQKVEVIELLGVMPETLESTFWMTTPFWT